MANRNVIKRHQYADYLNIGTSTDQWVLMGTGFTSLDEELGAQTETTKYVNESSSSSELVSYESSFPFEADQIMEEEAVAEIYKIARNRLTGGEAKREYCRVELWDSATGENQFKARKFSVTVQVDNLEGENKQTMSGSLLCDGDPVFGKFNTATKTFTADTTV